MAGNIAMLVGALIWLGAELWGVFHKGPKPTTTSQWAWALEKHSPWVRVLFGTFIVSLFFHILWGTWLLP